MSLRSSRYSYSASRQVAIALTVASIVIVIAVPTAADIDSDDIFGEVEKRSGLSQSRQQYCGKRLVDALHVVCLGKYNGMFKQKKKTLGLLEDELLRKQESDPNFLQRQTQEDPYDPLRGMQEEPGYSAWISRPERLPFRDRLVAHAFSNGALRRQIRGAYDDCCKKGCSIQDLQMYCSS